PRVRRDACCSGSGVDINSTDLTSDDSSAVATGNPYNSNLQVVDPLRDCRLVHTVWLRYSAVHRPSAFRVLEQLWQLTNRAAKEGNVVKSVLHDCFSHSTGLSAVAGNNKDAGVVIGHRQTPVILSFGGVSQGYRDSISQARPRADLCCPVDQYGS